MKPEDMGPGRIIDEIQTALDMPLPYALITISKADNGYILRAFSQDNAKRCELIARGPANVLEHVENLLRDTWPPVIEIGGKDA